MYKPKVIVLCGSSKFCQPMAVCAWLLEKHEGAITMGRHLLAEFYFRRSVPHNLAEHEGVADAMDELHLRKIDLADEIFLVNCNGYIGDSTRREIAYATKRGLPIREYEDDYIGEEVRKLIQTFLREQESKSLKTDEGKH